MLLCIALLRVFEYPVRPLQYVGCLFGLQGVVTHSPPIDNPLWSLAYEMWFYLLAGCAVVVAERRKYRTGAWLTAAAGIALSLGILCLRLEWINLVCWLIGAAGFGLRHRLAKGTRPWAAFAGLLLMLAGWAAFRPDLLSQWPPLANINQWSGVNPLAHLLLSSGTMPLVVSVCLSAPGTRVGAWIERAGTLAAAFSYTLYSTYHPVIITLMWTVGVLPEIPTWYSLLRLGEWMALCAGVAAVMYALFERQTPQARRWLRALLGGGPARAKTTPDRLPLAVEA